jgi:hypothetical protein
MFGNEKKVRKFKVPRQEKHNRWISFGVWFSFFADRADLTGIAGHAS